MHIYAYIAAVSRAQAAPRTRTTNTGKGLALILSAHPICTYIPHAVDGLHHGVDGLLCQCANHPVCTCVGVGVWVRARARESLRA